jgi:hypothetical protein
MVSAAPGNITVVPDGYGGATVIFKVQSYDPNGVTIEVRAGAVTASLNEYGSNPPRVSGYTESTRAPLPLDINVALSGGDIAGSGGTSLSGIKNETFVVNVTLGELVFGADLDKWKFFALLRVRNEAGILLYEIEQVQRFGDVQ